MEDVFKDIGLTLFKTCTHCHRTWSDREGFLRCHDLVLVGYQPNFDDIEAGFLLFNHITEGCGSTFAVSVAKFSDLYKGPRFSESKKGSDECGRHFLNIKDLSSCKAECKYAYVREVLQIVIKALAA